MVILETLGSVRGMLVTRDWAILVQSGWIKQHLEVCNKGKIVTDLSTVP